MFLLHVAIVVIIVIIVIIIVVIVVVIVIGEVDRNDKQSIDRCLFRINDCG
jgi:hypothetical protein